VAELDGVWEVKRSGGALPPLVGVRKRIHGTRGETIVGPVRLPFRVEGLTLRYEPPFAALVDELEAGGEGRFRGRATLAGRDYGTFELRRIRMPDTDITEELRRHLDEAVAMEQNVLRMLDGMIKTTDDPQMLDALEHHRTETEEHERLMRSRLEATGGSPSAVRELGGLVGALVKLPLDLVRGDKAGRNARDGYATEHMEIASYELLKRVALRADDAETVAACESIIAQERAMAQRIEEGWDVAVEQSLRDAGVPVG
jgi:ferritin-like metal-binding protein YciE